MLADSCLMLEIAPCGGKRHSELLFQAVLGFKQMFLYYLYI